MKRKIKVFVLLIFISFFSQNTFSYEIIKIIAVDEKLWSEIKIPSDWVYKECQGSFVEYPGFMEPTIHYILHFKDGRNHKIEMRFNRFKGILEKNAFILDLTDFSEKYIKIN